MLDKCLPPNVCSQCVESDVLEPLSCFTRQLSRERSTESPAAAGTSDLLLGGAHKDGRRNEDRVDKDLDQSANVQGVVHG